MRYEGFFFFIGLLLKIQVLVGCCPVSSGKYIFFFFLKNYSAFFSGSGSSAGVYVLRLFLDILTLKMKHHDP